MGSGQAYATLGAVPWLNLQPCDTVSIHPGTYHEMVYIAARGRANQYITIQGIPDGSGNYPIIDGANAVMPTNSGYLPVMQSFGVFMISKPSVTHAAGYKPGYLWFKNLQIRGANSSNNRTDAWGNVAAWGSTGSCCANGTSGGYPVGNFVAGMYVQTVEHLVLDHIIFNNNSLGLFVNSVTDGVNGNDWQSRDLLITHCYFFNNGVVNDAGKHHAYTEAIGTTYEYNYFAPTIAGSAGSAVKDRSPGIMMRYNYIHDTATAFDLRDPQGNQAYEAAATDQWGATMVSMAFIYSNIVVFDANNPFGVVPFVLNYGDGGQGIGSQIRYGNVYFNRNVIVANFPSTQNQSVPIFTFVNTTTPNSANNNPGIHSPQFASARNNLFWDNGNQVNGFGLFFYQGAPAASPNQWQSNLTTGYSNTTSAPGSGTDGVLSVGTEYAGSPATNMTVSSQNPQFTNAAAGNYIPTSSAWTSLTATYQADVTMRSLAPADVPVVTPATPTPTQ